MRKYDKMEEDNLLLNFDTSSLAGSESSKGASSKVTGGRWKQRRRLQRSLEGKTRTRSKPNSVEHVKGTPDISSGEKERNKHPKRKAFSDMDNESIEKRPRIKEKLGEAGGKDGSYISSLFTSKELISLKSQDDDTESYNASPSNAPLADKSTFAGLGIVDKLNTHLTERLNFKSPTKIQQEVIPMMSNASHDIFVKAQTGSGKTLSFLLPIFNQLVQEQSIERTSGLFAIILAPTRELSNQIYEVAETISRANRRIVPGVVIGGEKKKSEKARIRKGINILIATPGRLADHLENTSSLDISQIRWLVLDEGDKLMELGFQETIMQITSKINANSEISRTQTKWKNLPNRRLNVLCSATVQKNVQQLGEIVLDNPQLISSDQTVDFDDTSAMDEQLSIPDQLVQRVLVVPPKLRLVTLNGILKNTVSGKQEADSINRTIVFLSCSDSVEFHYSLFSKHGQSFHKAKNPETGKLEYTKYLGDDDNEKPTDQEEMGFSTSPLLGKKSIVFKLHGSLTQKNRTTTLQAFVKGRLGDGNMNYILFCTDVAARGLDLPHISNVIEYDPPFTVEDHLHRIGRSARVGNEGIATLFLLPGNEEKYVDQKLKAIHRKEGSMSVQNYESILKKSYSISATSDGKVNGAAWDTNATTWQLNVERWLLEDTDKHDLALKAFISHVRAYATHLASEREIFNVKALHLGHLAKSFGLRESPKQLGRSGTSYNTGNGAVKAKKMDPRKQMLKMAKLAANASSNEFNISI